MVSGGVSAALVVVRDKVFRTEVLPALLQVLVRKLSGRVLVNLGAFGFVAQNFLTADNLCWAVEQIFR